ncbi:phage holin family protein [Chitinophaga sp. CC14]|uniref:phage holin family protein n=1 Tax=Chitinophaga sp. CC14 TaxID=3029199 RepID=UPI003B7B7712
MELEINDRFVTGIRNINIVWPNTTLLVWVYVAMVFDLVTGVAKSIVLKMIRTSTGMMDTLKRFIQYTGAIVAAIILANVAPKDNLVTGYISDALLVLIIYIEVFTIFDNLKAIDNNSLFSKYFITPILKLLTFSLKKNTAQNSEDEK